MLINPKELLNGGESVSSLKYDLEMVVDAHLGIPLDIGYWGQKIPFGIYLASVCRQASYTIKLAVKQERLICL